MFPKNTPKAHKLFVALILCLATASYAAKTRVNVYRCAVCEHIEQFEEGQQGTHYCDGSASGKKHSRTEMIYKGHQEIDTKR